MYFLGDLFDFVDVFWGFYKDEVGIGVFVGVFMLDGFV